MHAWDPDRYLTFAEERGRPFHDLIARVGATRPQTVVDLGCGPGNLTAELAARWPDALVLGLDSSPEMIDRATPGPGLTFEVADLRDWAPAHPVDVLVSNATLQWVPDHLDLLPRLLDSVSPGGWFAFQVPGNFDQPSHTLRAELAAEPRYAEYTRGIAAPAAHSALVYLEALAGLGARVEAWETTYLHVLDPGDPDPVFTWISGTGARPTLAALPDDLRPEFEAELRVRLRKAYPPGTAGVVLPFRRVFVVAQVGAGPENAPGGR